MPDDDNWEREASKEDPGGFEKLQALTKKLLSVPKAEGEKLREAPGPNEGKQTSR